MPPRVEVPTEIAVSHFVEALNQVARLLKLNRQEEGCRDIDAASLTTLLRVCEAARQGYALAFIKLIRPEIQSAAVWRAVEEVEVVLSHKEGIIEAGVINWVRPVNGFVAVYRNDHRDWRSDRASISTTQIDLKLLSSLAKRVVNGKDRDSCRSFTGGEMQGADRSLIIPPLAGINIAGRVVDGRRLRRVTSAGDKNISGEVSVSLMLAVVALN